MPLFERSFNDLMQDSMVDLIQNTRLTRITPGAKARAILEATNRNLNEAYRTFDLNFSRAFISGASGRYLDFIGEMLGLGRDGVLTANASADSKTVKFFVEIGTFGDINSGSSIVIPQGTNIATSAELNDIVYRTVVPTVLSLSASEAFVSVEAITSGRSANVGPSALQFHDFLTYTDVDNDSLKVINVGSIQGGAEVESDTNYRFRLSRQTLNAERANPTAIRTASLLIPGVADVSVIPFFKGVGSFRVLIKSTTPTVAESLIEAVNAAISEIAAQGIIAEAERPKESGMQFTIKLTFRRKLPGAERDSIEDAVRTAMRSYINGLDIGEDFIVNEGVQRVLDVSEDIKDIGKPTKPFDEIFVHRETRLRDNRIRTEVLGNLTPEVFERLIIEPSLSVPIKILRAN